MAHLFATNELLWFVMLLANFVLILAVYRFAGLTGLFLWVPIATIVANIQVVKMVTLFGIEATLGNIVYASSFLITDILSEIYGRRQAQRAIWFGFFSLFSFTLLMNMALWFTPSAEDFAQQSMETIFRLMPRLAVASLCAYAVSQFHDIFAFEFWRRRFPGDRHLWIRNNLSTFVSQGLDSLVFTAVAFVGLFPLPVLLQILVSTCLLKWVVALADTPFLYIARSLHRSGRVTELL